MLQISVNIVTVRLTVRPLNMNAWLLTWEGTEGPALLPDKKIIAILASRKSDQSILDLVDILYRRSVDSAYYMAFLANKRKLREYQYRHPGNTGNGFLYGRNPCIFARRVSDLTVVRDKDLKTELIRWTELALFQNANSGSGIVQTQPPRCCQHVRSLEPLALDIYERKY